MGDSHPPNKRRRLDVAAALSRPFKSPLRKPDPLEDVSQTLPCTPDASGAAKDEAVTSTELTPKLDYPTSSPMSSQGKRTIRPTHRSAFATPSQSPFADPELLRLQKQERAVQSRLTALREELNVAKQALRIESANKVTEIEGLIAKWRHASQEAADEVFAGAQERVTKMGGLVAWRERSKRDTFQWDLEKEKEPGHVDEYENERWKLGDILVEENDGSKVHEKESNDEDFSMDFMLKSLNIDPRIIGYDSAMGKWIRG